MSQFIPTFWYRRFGIAEWSLMVSDQGIHVASSFYPWEEVSRCTARRGLFGWNLDFEGARGLKLKGASGMAAHVIPILCATASTIRRSSSRLNQVLSEDRYISDFDRREVERELTPEIERLRRLSPDAALRHVPTLKILYEDVQAFLSRSRTEIDRRNHEYVEREIAQWGEWFSVIEKTPLTPEQIRAVIVMEDRNLLIAAAGSGKSSTIVAKAAYAVAKGYCTASEVLVLTFNRRVREELTQRLSSRLEKMGLPTDVQVQTFNAFGLAQAKKLKKNVKLAPWAKFQDKAINHLQSLIGNLITQDPEFAARLAEFCAVWLESDEKEQEEIIAATSARTFEQAFAMLLARSTPAGSVPRYTTLAGCTVRSLQELRISNWLTLMGVEFDYERPFPEDLVPMDWTSGYRPDFYYPGIDCWHEHFGINKLGKAPPWMSTPKPGKKRTYEQEVKEKRALLSSRAIKWFETTSAHFDDGSWKTRLEDELTARGLKPEFIGWQSFVEQFQSMAAANKAIVGLMLSCIQHAKSNRLDPEAIKKLMPAVGASRTRAYLQVFAAVYAEYEKYLKSQHELDYEDMVLISADALLDHALIHPYRIILVDEFQDVSNSRADLVSALLSTSPAVKLFGVGDDWQSIYRFAGADITAMTKFSERFGYTSSGFLTRTFRSNQRIADAASQFVMRNPDQLRKIVVAPEVGSEDSIEVVFHAGEDSDVEYLEKEVSSLAEALRKSGQRKSMFLLGRYNFLKPKAFEQWQEMHGDVIEMSFLSIHKAKGLEADIVFLLGASNKKGRDFPSTIQDDPLLSLFMPVPDRMPWAEERRLFYVALTRARDKVYILSPEGFASPFVAELLASQKAIQTLFSGGKKTLVVDSKPHLKLRQCPKCEKGSVIKRVSQFGPFEFCTLQCGFKKNLGH